MIRRSAGSRAGLSALALGALLLLPALVTAIPAPARAQDREEMSLGEQRIRMLTIPSLEWRVPAVGREVVRKELDNGAVLYVYPDHRFPLVDVLFQFRAGSFYEPVEKAGLADMTLNLMRTGGTTEHGYQEIDQELDDLAAEVGVSAGDQACTLDLNVLAKDLDRGLAVLAEMIRKPAYPPERIDFRKNEVKAAIRRQNDNPRSAAFREFDHLAFGDHPYGRSPEWDRVRSITGDDLHAYHDRYYVPDNCYIAVAGDVDPEEIAAALDRAFGDWAPGRPDFPAPPPETEQVEPPAVVLYPRDLTQTAIVFGCPGITRESPDLHAAQVLNYVLGGGGFSSRLLQQVRDRAGLAYSVSSSLPTDRTDPGPFTVQCQTKTASTVEALGMMRDIVAGMATEPIPAVEFQAAQDALVNGFVRSFSSPERVVQALMNLEFDGRPADWYDGTMDRIRAVTPAQVQDLAGRLLGLDRMITVLVGNVEPSSEPLSRFGTVSVRELEEPALD